MFPFESEKGIQGVDPNKVATVVVGIKRITTAAINLRQMGLDPSVSLHLFGNSSMNIDEDLVGAIHAGDCSMLEIVSQPKTREFFIERDMRNHPHLDLLRAILTPGTTAMMRLTTNELKKLEDLQDGESSKRFQSGEIHKKYRELGGKAKFQGAYYWGLLCHNGANFPLDFMTGEVRHLLNLATLLPHVYYECLFKADADGYGAKLSQRLVIDPRLAVISSGFEEWYMNLPSKPIKP